MPGRVELFIPKGLSPFSITMQTQPFQYRNVERKRKSQHCCKRHRSQRNSKKTKTWPLRNSNENKFTGQSPNNSFLFSSQVCHQTVSTRAGKMAQWAEALDAHGTLSLIPSAHIKMEEKNEQIQKAALWYPHVHHRAVVHTHIHTNT